MLRSEFVIQSVFGFEFGIDRNLIGVVMGDRRIYLCQRHLRVLRYNLFGDQALLVQHCNPANGETRSSDAWPSASHSGGSRNQAADLDFIRHQSEYSYSMR